MKVDGIRRDKVKYRKYMKWSPKPDQRVTVLDSCPIKSLHGKEGVILEVGPPTVLVEDRAYCLLSNEIAPIRE